MPTVAPSGLGMYDTSDTQESFSTGSECNYRETILEVASSLIGELSVRYVYGHPEWGRSPEQGFDCSGFVTFVLTQAGLSVPEFMGQDGRPRPIRHAGEYWDHYGVMVHEDARLPGDLLFFSRRGTYPTHIGIVRDEESYIHAPGRNATKVSVEGIKKEAIMLPPKDGFRRLYTTNPIGYKAPTIASPHPTYRYHQIVL